MCPFQRLYDPPSQTANDIKGAKSNPRSNTVVSSIWLALDFAVVEEAGAVVDEEAEEEVGVLPLVVDAGDVVLCPDAEGEDVDAAEELIVADELDMMARTPCL